MLQMKSKEYFSLLGKLDNQQAENRFFVLLPLNLSMLKNSSKDRRLSCPNDIFFNLSYSRYQPITFDDRMGFAMILVQLNILASYSATYHATPSIASACHKIF
jgi:hypothetical protein